MLDSDLAEMYGVQTKVLNQAVSRNAARFPSDFAFQLTAAGVTHLRSQLVTSSAHGGPRYAPRAFTEQGVAMLSSALRSRRAIDWNCERPEGPARAATLIANARSVDRPSLPSHDRARLAELLLASLEERDADAEALWNSEIDRRSTELATGRVVGIAATDVFAEVERRLRR